jgi:spore coat polysaccharide biosynthesis protein SpsF
MLDALGIVQAPCDAARIKNCISRKLGGKSLLEWVVRRATDCQRLDGVIVALGDDPAERAIADLIPSDVPVFYAPGHDAVGRLAAAVRKFAAKSVVLIQTDTPFVDPELIDRLVNVAAANPQCDYVSYCSRNGRPAVLSPIGLFAEWTTVKTLHMVDRMAVDKQDRNQPTRFIYSHPELFQLRLIPAPAPLDRDDVRLRIDLEEDWDHAVDIVEALGADSSDWQRIASLLDNQPALRERMATLNREATTVG